MCRWPRWSSQGDVSRSEQALYLGRTGYRDGRDASRPHEPRYSDGNCANEDKAISHISDGTVCFTTQHVA